MNGPFLQGVVRRDANLNGKCANTVKPLLSGHLQDLPKYSLNRCCKNCAMFG